METRSHKYQKLLIALTIWLGTGTFEVRAAANNNVGWQEKLKYAVAGAVGIAAVIASQNETVRESVRYAVESTRNNFAFGATYLTLSFIGACIVNSCGRELYEFACRKVANEQNAVSKKEAFNQFLRVGGSLMAGVCLFSYFSPGVAHWLKAAASSITIGPYSGLTAMAVRPVA